VKALVTHTERETIALGEEFARRLRPGDIVACYGDLGSGKTRFIKGVCRALGVKEHVASPTFTIVNEYHANGLTVIHFDFYRVTTLNEIIDIGFEEYINSDAICLIEWAENAQALLPPRRFEVRLELGKTEDTRTIMIGEENEVAA